MRAPVAEPTAARVSREQLVGGGKGEHRAPDHLDPAGDVVGEYAPPLRQGGEHVHAAQEGGPEIDCLAHALRAAVIKHPRLDDEAANGMSDDVEPPSAQGRLLTHPCVEITRSVAVAPPPVVGERERCRAVAEARGAQVHEQLLVGVDGPERAEDTDALHQAGGPKVGSSGSCRIDIEAAKPAERRALAPDNLAVRVHEFRAEDAGYHHHRPLRPCTRPPVRQQRRCRPVFLLRGGRCGCPVGCHGEALPPAKDARRRVRMSIGAPAGIAV